MRNNNYSKVTTKFYDKNLSEYIKNTKKLQDKEWINKFSKLLPKKSKVLDLGCGYGRDCKTFVELNFDTYGIDLSRKMVAKARKIAKKAKFKVMNILELKFSDKFFDGVWCSASLLHISKKDLPNAINEIKRVLKENGLCYLSVKLGKGEGMFKDKRYNNAKKFYSYYSEKEIKSLLNKNNFSIINFSIDKTRNNYKIEDFIHIIARK